MRLAEAVRRAPFGRAALWLGLAICATAPLLRPLLQHPAPEPGFEAQPDAPQAGGHSLLDARPDEATLALQRGRLAEIRTDWPRESARESLHESAQVGPREPPSEWDGKPLRPLALSAVEQRFAAQFPGRVARLTDGDAVLIWRDVTRPTRLLHPAADCYRALGYRIEHAALEHDARSRLWRCFIAVQGARRLRVCERIQDAAGASFTDASSWFWAAQLGRSRGPWQAITVTREL